MYVFVPRVKAKFSPRRPPDVASPWRFLSLIKGLFSLCAKNSTSKDFRLIRSPDAGSVTVCLPALFKRFPFLHSHRLLFLPGLDYRAFKKRRLQISSQRRGWTNICLFTTEIPLSPLNHWESFNLFEQRVKFVHSDPARWHIIGRTLKISSV